MMPPDEEEPLETQVVVSPPSSEEEVLPPPVRSSTSVVSPRPVSGTGTADLEHLQDMAQWQEEQRQLLAEQAIERRQALINLAEEREQARQALFDEREAERQRAFEEAEEERQREAEARREELFRVHEEHRAEMARAKEEARRDAEVSIRHSIAASEEAIGEVIEGATEDREKMEARLSQALEETTTEREQARFHVIRLGTKAEQEHEQIREEQRERIRMLEEELDRQRETSAAQMERFENVEAERWENRRLQDEQQQSAVQAQLHDITNVLQDRAVDAARWRELDEERLLAKEPRRQEKAEQMQALQDMVNGIIADREEERRIREEEKAAEAAKPGTSKSDMEVFSCTKSFSGIEAILEAINRQNAEQALLMSNLVNGTHLICVCAKMLH